MCLPSINEVNGDAEHQVGPSEPTSNRLPLRGLMKAEAPGPKHDGSLLGEHRAMRSMPGTLILNFVESY